MSAVVATQFEGYLQKTLSDFFGMHKAEAIMSIASGIRGRDEKNAFYKALLDDMSNVSEEGTITLSSMSALTEKRFTPVDPKTFAEDPFYLGLKGEIYPEVLTNFIEVNSGKYDEAVFTGAIGTAKALDVNTLVPTPDGWVRNGDIVDGQIIYGKDGNPCRVLKAHPYLYDRKCYRVVFDDGHEIVACEDHLWEVQSNSDRTNWKKTGKTHRVISTKEMAAKVLLPRNQPNWSIDVAGPVEGREQLLGCDPYVLGYWLGDGTCKNGAITVGDQDLEDFIQQAGKYYTLSINKWKDREVASRVTPYGLIYALRRLGVLDNKHVPELVLRASREQRLAVLQGLMDSDGTACKRQGTATFSVVCKPLAQGVYRLALSLGFKARYKESTGNYGGKVFPLYSVRFVPTKDDVVFRLARKQQYVGLRDTGIRANPSKRRYIRAIEPVESRPVRCLTVDSPDSLYLVGEGYIPTHNTTLAVWSNAYQLYLLSSYANPHRMFGLDRSSEILFVFQSLNKHLAAGVDYARFKALIQRSPYFTDHYPFNKDLESELSFPNRISVKPISGEQTGAIGQNVFGGLIDEINYMQVVENSKQAADGTTYDQAIALYNSIARRRKSRFMKRGALPGLLCIVSSKRYPGQFTDTKQEEHDEDIRKYGKSRIFIYDKKTWEVLPQDRFTGEYFNMFVGDEHRRPRILGEGETLPEKDRDLILPVPVEYRTEFEEDPMEALREIGGVSTLARYPYLPDTEKVSGCFNRHRSILSSTTTDFHEDPLLILPKRFYKPELPRFAHIDLGVTGDAAGLSMGCVDGFKNINRSDTVECLPNIRMDFTLRVRPPKGGEIQFHKIRALLYKLRELGINLRWVSLDSFQSVDMIQLLRQQGLTTGLLSLDTSTLPYDITKTTIYDGRLQAPRDDHASKELVSLERDPKKNKIDHPPKFSKDVADSIGGVVYGLTMRREVWAMFGVSTFNIPESVRQVMVKSDKLRGANENEK